MKRFTRFIRLLMLSTAAVILASCGNTATSPTVTGNLSGRVVLMDESGNITADSGGVTISIKGTHYSAMTAADGTWKIADLPQGTYTLTASKPGYFPFTDPAFRFVGRGDDYYPAYNSRLYLIQTPQFTITEMAVVARPIDTLFVDNPPGGPPDSISILYNQIAISGTISAPAAPNAPSDITLTLTTKPAGSSGDSTVQYYMSLSLQKARTSFGYLLGAETLRGSGIPSGTRVYIIAYPGNYRVTIGEDPITFRPYPLHVTPASNEVSVVVP
ncbi:MAG: carboxypeptidase-like regulatory domain-containing protein [Candidatus Kapaibacterium sp.]